jgi:hypothetical protein
MFKTSVYKIRFSKTHLNIAFPSTRNFSKQSLPLCFTTNILDAFFFSPQIEALEEQGADEDIWT